MTVLYWSALLGVIAAGVLFRSWGVVVGTVDFWADEAWWAVNMEVRSLISSGIRPVGYMWLSSTLAGFGYPEVMLRLPSYLAGMATMVCVYFSARRLFDSRLVVVLAVTLVAFHPQLITYAKEFKPYSLEVFIHSGLTLWALHCHTIKRVSPSFCLAAVAAFPFCYNILFLYPALLCLLLSIRYREKRGALVARLRVTPVYRTIAWTALALIAVVILHLSLFGLLEAGWRSFTWGVKYDVFPVGLGILQATAWYAQKTWDLLLWPGTLHGLSAVTDVALAPVIACTYVAGVASFLVQRRHVELCLLAGSPLMVLVANLLGYWPYGAFRTNVFLIPGMVLVACQGLQWLMSHRRSRGAALVLIVALIAASMPVDFGRYRLKHMRDGAPSPPITRVLDTIQGRIVTDDSVPVNVILADWHSWRAMYYYLEHSSRGLRDYAALHRKIELLRGPLNDAGELASMLEAVYARAVERDEYTRVWLVTTKQSQFAGMLAHPLVVRTGAYTRRFDPVNADYHPVLIELHFGDD